MGRIIRQIIEIRFWLLKAGLGFYLSILISKLLKFPDMLSPAFATILCIQPTIYTGLKRGIEEIVVSFLSALTALVFILLFGQNEFVFAIVLMAGMAVIYLAKMSASMPIAIFTILYITLFPGGSVFATTVNRFIYIITGVAIAFLINYAFSFFVYRDLIVHQIENGFKKIIELFTAFTKGIARGDESTIKISERRYHQEEGYFRHLMLEIEDLKKEQKIRGTLRFMKKDVFYRLERVFYNVYNIFHLIYELMNLWREYINLGESRIKNTSHIKFDVISTISLILSDLENLFNAFKSRDRNIVPSRVCNLDVLVEEITNLYNQMRREEKFYKQGISDVMLMYSIIMNLRQINIAVHNLHRHIPILIQIL